MILVSQHYVVGDEKRDAELSLCMETNKRSKLFSSVEYLDGRARPLGFDELISHCNDSHRGEVCVIANSDITFDSTAVMIVRVAREGRLVALTRWERGFVCCPRMLGHVADDFFFSGTQDAWAFIGGELPPPGEPLPFGVLGCEQRLAGHAFSNGIEVVNPALDIKTWHVHESKERPDRPCVSGYYCYPHLTTLSTSGLMLCHEWPVVDPASGIKWEIRSLRQSL